MADSIILRPLQLITLRRIYDLTTTVGVVSALAAYLYTRIETFKKEIQNHQQLQRKIDKINDDLAKIAANVEYLKSAKVQSQRLTTEAANEGDNVVDTDRTAPTTDAQTDTNSKAVYHGTNRPLSSASPTDDPSLREPITAEEIIQVRAR